MKDKSFVVVMLYKSATEEVCHSHIAYYPNMDTAIEVETRAVRQRNINGKMCPHKLVRLVEVPAPVAKFVEIVNAKLALWKKLRELEDLVGELDGFDDQLDFICSGMEADYMVQVDYEENQSLLNDALTKLGLDPIHEPLIYTPEKE